jgi:hypothetical protein
MVPIPRVSSWEELNTRLEAQGFSLSITADNGQTYRMPWAEYNGSGALSNAQVRSVVGISGLLPLHGRTGKDPIARHWVSVSVRIQQSGECHG